MMLNAANGELLRGKGHKITRYELEDKSSILLTVKVPGGGSRLGRLTPIPGEIGVTYDQPDMISLNESTSEARAIMPCGHVIS